MRLYLAVLVVAGCTESRSPVHGSISYRYPDGTLVPVDLSGELFQAYVLSGAGYVAHPQTPVSGTTVGTFDIPDVPDGPFLLRRSTTGFYGVFSPEDDHRITQSWDVLGRPGAAEVNAPTMLEIEAGGLTAWQATDRLTIDCFGNASEVVDPTLTPALTAGATTIRASFDWAAGYSWGATGSAYLMDAAAGDDVVIAHATTSTVGGVRSSSVTQVLRAAAPTQIEGQPSQVTGAFVDVAMTAKLTVSVPGDELAATLETGASPGDQGATLVAGPGTDSGALLGPELARVSTRTATQPLDASIRYGNPFDAAWTPRVTAWYTASRHLDAGIHGPLDIAYTAYTDSAPLTHDQFRLDPLTPVAAPMLNGALIAGQTLAIPPHQPLHLEFSAPAEATKARVVIWRVDKSYEAAYLEVSGSEVDLPIDIFQNGGRYAFQIDVYADDGAGRTRSASTFTDAITIVAQ
jgi:hypothetical protein